MTRARRAEKVTPKGGVYRDQHGEKSRDALDTVSSSTLADRIESNGIASHDMQARIEDASTSVGSAARTTRLKQQSAKLNGPKPSGTPSRRELRLRRATLAREVADQLAEDERRDARKREEQESDIDLDDSKRIRRRIEEEGEAIRRPLDSAGKVMRRRAGETGYEALRRGASRLRATRQGINRGDKSDEGRRGGRGGAKGKRGIAERAMANAESEESRAARLRRAEMAATRAIGSSTAVAIETGADSSLPMSLAGLARRSAAKVAAAVGNAMVGAAGTAVSAIAAALPALAPILVIAALLGTILYSIVSIAAIQASHSLGGGQAIAAIAEQEYAAGAARGDYNRGGIKYRSWFGVDGDWCAMFVCWCADQCGFIDQGIVPRQGFAGFDAYYGPRGSGENPGYTIYGAANYAPQPGDIFIYGGNAPENVSRGAGFGDHVALVTTVLEDGSFYTVEGNTSGPGSGGDWSTRVVNRKLHERVAGGWTGTTWAGDFCVVRPAYPVSQGQVIEIPEPYGNGGFTVTEYDLWFEDWADGTNQRVVADEWAAGGRRWRDDIASIDGRYLIACTTTYGTVGDRLTFYLSDGTAIPCIMADAKSMSDQGCNVWGHSNGQNVLEFQVRSSRYRADGNPGSSAWMPQWAGKRVVRCVNESRVATGVSSDDPRRATAVSAAMSQVGYGYVWGEQIPGVGFDCNGLTNWAWAQAGVSIPYPSGHYGYGQFQWLKASGRWVYDANQLQPGDLVFYSYDGGASIYHVAMYIGNGRIVHACDPSNGICVWGVYDCGGFCGGGSPI